jgi:hypothetical protein
MKLFLFALLLAASSRVVLDDTIEIPQAEWRYVDIVAKEPKMVVNCRFEVLSEQTQVRAVWIARKDLERFRAGSREQVLAATPFGEEGNLRHFAPEAGDYAIALENDPAKRARAKVKVKVWMEPAASPVYASPTRRLIVIVISGIVFLAIVTFSARRIIPSVRRSS